MAGIETKFNVGGGGVFNCTCDIPLNDIYDFFGKCPVFASEHFPKNVRVFQEHKNIPNYRVIVIQSIYGTNINAQNKVTKSTPALRHVCSGCKSNKFNQR